MKAIKTKYHGPTNTRGSRISASDCDGNRVSIAYPHEPTTEEGHRLAVRELCRKMGWKGEFHTGSFPDCYVHVFVTRSFK